MQYSAYIIIIVHATWDIMNLIGAHISSENIQIAQQSSTNLELLSFQSCKLSTLNHKQSSAATTSIDLRKHDHSMTILPFCCFTFAGRAIINFFTSNFFHETL